MSKQPVNTSSYAMVKAIEDLEKNPYFDKYAAKIAKAQKSVLTKWHFNIVIIIETLSCSITYTI